MFRILTGCLFHDTVRVIVVGQRCKGVMAEGFRQQCHFEHSLTGRVDRRWARVKQVNPGSDTSCLFDDYASPHVTRGCADPFCQDAVDGI